MSALIASPIRVSESWTHREGQLKKTFKYFDKDEDGFITGRELVDILAALGKSRTSFEMRRIYFCLNPSKISETDFLNLMATSLVSDHLPRKTLIRDAFQLFNAVKYGFSSSRSSGRLEVADRGALERKDFEMFLSKFMTPLGVKTQPINARSSVRPFPRRYKYDVDLAIIAPNIYVEFPTNAEDCYEGHRVSYEEWLKKVKFPRVPRDRKHEMIRSFRIYNLVYGDKDGKLTPLGDLEVSDNNLISTTDLRKMMVTLGEPLDEIEIEAFMKRAEAFAEKDGKHVNYKRLCEWL